MALSISKDSTAKGDRPLRTAIYKAFSCILAVALCMALLPAGIAAAVPAELSDDAADAVAEASGTPDENSLQVNADVDAQEDDVDTLGAVDADSLADDLAGSGEEALLSADPDPDSDPDPAFDSVEDSKPSLLSVQAASSGSSTGMKAAYAEAYDEAAGMPTGNANEWQVVSQKYTEVKAGSGTYAYSAGDSVRLQKAVMAAGAENEFQVYLNVEPQLSWEEFFKSLDNYSTHNKSSTFNPNSGCSRLLSQDEYNALSTSEKSWYELVDICYNMGDGTHYDVVRFGNFHGNDKDQVQSVPNGSYAWSSEKFNTNGLILGIDWRSLVSAAQSGSTDLKLEIDASGLKKKYSFATKPVYPQTVTDPMGANIIYDGLVSADLGSVDEPDEGSIGGTLTWSLPVAAYPDLSYFSIHAEEGKIPGTQVDGLVTVLENIEVAENNGKQTAYYTGLLELRYAIRLDVMGEGFVSSAPVADAPASSAIVNTNKKTLLSYRVGAAANSAEFPIPQVKGLLYDLEVQKVDADDASKGLAGAVFELLNARGDPVLDEANSPMTATSGVDGIAKFRNLPFGTYSVREVTPPKGYRIIDDNVYGPYELCWTTNKALVRDHANLHETDQSADARNMTVAGGAPSVPNKKAVGLTILKEDGDSKAPIAGVEFALKVDDGDGEYTDADAAAEAWVDSLYTRSGSKGETDVSGTLSFYGLTPGTYWIVETRTVPGYQVLPEPVKMVITEENRVYFHAARIEATLNEDSMVNITIDNFKVPVLPITGTSSALPVYLAGVVLAVAAVVLNLWRRRKPSGCGNASGANS